MGNKYRLVGGHFAADGVRGSYDTVTNVTVEVNGAVEAALFLIWQSQLPRPLIPLGSTILLRADATYIIGLVEHRFTPKENVQAARLLQHLWDVVRRSYVVTAKWVKGHS